MVRAIIRNIVVCLLVSSTAWGNTGQGSVSPPADSPYVQAVRQFADNVLAHGRDTFGHTPLFVDGVNVDTFEPAIWRLPAACSLVWRMPKRSVLCNVASQQNLFRTLDGLTTTTGDPKYRQAAVDAMSYTFKHLSHRSGLLYWGGHCAFDLLTGKPIGESHKDWLKLVPVPATWDTGLVHELKHHYPYFELMWQIDPKATQKYVGAFWGTHILKWTNLDMNRHGFIGQGAGPGWDHEYSRGNIPFKGKGLSLLHTGSDLMYAAAMLTILSDDERPLTWAKRMAKQYADIRHPITKLGPEVYSHYRHERMLAQFGPEWGKQLTETTIASMYSSRFGSGPLGLLKIAERLGPRGEEFKQLAIEDLAAFAKYAYDPDDNSFRPMLTDGTILPPDIIKRPGPMPPNTFQKRTAGSTSFWAYAIAAHLDSNPLLRETARNIGLRLDLGDIGTDAKSPPRLNMNTACNNPYVIFALLDMQRLTGRDEYLALADRVGKNLLAQEFFNGFFVQSKHHLFCKFDTISPLALLHLDAALNHRPEPLPFYSGSHSYFHCDYKGKGRTYDGLEIYSILREDSAKSATKPADAK